MCAPPLPPQIPDTQKFMNTWQCCISYAFHAFHKCIVVTLYVLKKCEHGRRH